MESAKVVQRFLESEGRADVEAVRATLSDDNFVFESPFSATGASSTVEGADVWCGYMAQYIAPESGHYTDWHFYDICVYPAADGENVFAEWKGKAIVAKTGMPYSNDYIAHFRVKNGKIELFREYRDPIRTSAALSSGKAE